MSQTDFGAVLLLPNNFRGKRDAEKSSSFDHLFFSQICFKVIVLVCWDCCNKIPQAGGQTFIFCSAGGWESEITVWADLVPGEALFLVCRQPPSCCVLT